MTEPAGEVLVQTSLVVADPGHMAVRAEQDGRLVQRGGGVRDQVHPVRPASDGQAFGSVQDEPTALTELVVEAPLFQVDVPQAAAERVGAGAEVVADVDRGD